MKIANHTTVWEQAQRMATHDIRALVDMLFENFYSFVAEPRACNNTESMLAASTVRRKMAAYFGDAETLRSGFVYLTDRGVQEFYMQFGMVAPSLMARYPERYAQVAENSLVRPAVVERASIDLQRSSIEGENGNSRLTWSRAQKERNAYVQHFNIPYQIGLGRFYDSDNYVSKLDETRAQTKMLHKKNPTKKSKKNSEFSVTKTKMSKAECESIRAMQMSIDESAQAEEKDTIEPRAKKPKKQNVNAQSRPLAVKSVVLSADQNVDTTEQDDTASEKTVVDVSTTRRKIFSKFIQ